MHILFPLYDCLGGGPPTWRANNLPMCLGYNAGRWIGSRLDSFGSQLQITHVICFYPVELVWVIVWSYVLLYPFCCHCCFLFTN